jgi:neutral ceramidase
MGYARATQNGHGIHQRLRARAFIISERPTSVSPSLVQQTEEILASEEEYTFRDELAAMTEEQSRLRSARYAERTEEQTRERNTIDTALTPDPDRTICFVSVDIGMGSDLLNIQVLERLEDLLPPLLPPPIASPKRLCHIENLSISGTHTHSAPGGFLQYALYQFTSLGFSKQVLDAYVEGVAQAILRAYKQLQPANIQVAEALLKDANINRSPSSYLLNPAEERERYAEHGDTDKTMLQLSFTAAAGKPLGLLNWFPVHGTSMNSSNLLISGDNKGYASYLAEKHFNGADSLPGQEGGFVAAFASTNLGDVSPNTAGPVCIDTGLPCDGSKTSCEGDSKKCIASGPGKDMFESTEIIGRRQYERAVDLWEKQKVDWSLLLQGGEVKYRHSFIDMSQLNVTLDSGEIVQTCPAALGYSFAGGTTDGPGDFNFVQGTNTSNPFWNMVSGFLSIPSRKQIDCQAPKPILLNTGRVSLPYDWDPNRVPISIFQVGQIYILNVPCEFTTMAGRRLRQAVRDVLVNKGGIHDPIVTIAGLANSYTHYVTTHQEYVAQRYEAASTLYGPHTLSAYIQEFRRITSDLVNGRSSASGKAPKDSSKKMLSLVPPVGVDLIGIGRKFGSVAVDAHDQYKTGQTVAVSFCSANPRNNLRTESTFLTVDVLDDSGQWQTRYVDGDWCTQFHWKGGVEYWGTSFAEIHWEIPTDTPRGLYRICHFGTRRTLIGFIEQTLYQAPAWLTSNLLGSYAFNLVVQSVQLVVHLSGFVRHFTKKLGHMEDFEGCSRAFLVHPS